jgi:hypothetical protein
MRFFGFDVKESSDLSLDLVFVQLLLFDEHLQLFYGELVVGYCLGVLGALFSVFGELEGERFDLFHKLFVLNLHEAVFFIFLPYLIVFMFYLSDQLVNP